MILSGNLSDWSVADLLQMLHVTKKTASLHVSGADRSGTVYFEEGKIVNAVVSLGSSSSADGQDGVIEAVYVLQLLDEGTFEMQNEVPSNKVDPMVVSDALELAALHVTAERDLEDSGLLAARGLRLAQTVDEPITLSEQVWNAISVSIPAFTFPELERRMGRAAAVSTIEQFRDLGVLEAAIEADFPAEQPADMVLDQPETFDDVGEIVPIGLAPTATFDEPIEEVVTPPTTMPLDPIVPVHQDGPHEITVEAPTSDILVAADEPFDEPVQDLVPADEEEPATEDDPADEADDEESSEQPAGVTSLADAIRAAAQAGGTPPTVAPETVDDESLLLAEAAGGEPRSSDAEETQGDDDHSPLRRTVRSLVSPPETTLVSGVIGDMGARFRRTQAESED